MQQPIDSANKTGRNMGSGEMFDRIADRYDMLNRIMSFGIDQGWRKRTVRMMNLQGKQEALDLACGTADLTIAVAMADDSLKVIGLDPSKNMIQVGNRKLTKRNLDSRVHLTLGSAESLPYEDNRFDGVSIAFGIRNVPDRFAALQEMARVCKPGGRIAILELSEPKRGILPKLAKFHIRHLVPRLGAILSGRKEYRYLQTSIAAFPPADEFATMMEESGIKILDMIPLTFGSCHIYVGTPKEEKAKA